MPVNPWREILIPCYTVAVEPEKPPRIKRGRRPGQGAKPAAEKWPKWSFALPPELLAQIQRIPDGERGEFVRDAIAAALRHLPVEEER